MAETISEAGRHVLFSLEREKINIFLLFHYNILCIHSYCFVMYLAYLSIFLLDAIKD